MPNALIHHRPTTELQAKFSMEFCLAILLLERKAGLAEFADCLLELAERPDAPKLDFVASHLGKRQFLMGDRFTVADAYLFTVLNWTGHLGIDLRRWPALQSYVQRVSARPAVRAAMEAEGLLRA